MQLSNEQKQVFLGGMLGDMCIFKGKNARDYRMNFAHSMNQSEYFFMKYEILKEIFKTEPRVRFWSDKRTDKQYREVRLQSLTDAFFTDMYHKWYKDGKRIVSDDVWGLNWLGLAVWFMDDGYRSMSGGLYFSTDRYSEGDKEILIDVLLKNFDIKANKQGKRIYIPKKYADVIRQKIAIFTPKSMIYKLVS